MNSEPEFNNDIKKLLQLLKKILKNQASADKMRELKQGEDELSSINFNVFIFPLVSLSAEELDEFEEIYEHFALDDERHEGELNPDLTESDREFLRRNGIRF